MATKWPDQLKVANKTCLVQDGRKKVHFTFADGREMAEEYDIQKNELVVRKWKVKGTFGGPGKWDFEVGEDLRAVSLDDAGFKESSANPTLIRKDIQKAFQWRVRNLPYPLPTYDIRVDEDQKNIVVRTSNKKYFKKIPIPDMERLQIPLEQSSVQFAHANNTLIITYQKPTAVLALEKQLYEELSKMKTANDGDVDCKQS